MLLVDWVEPRVDKRVFDDYNHFRQRMYAPRVTAALAKHEASLRHLFNVGAAGDSGASANAKLLSLSEWSAMLKALGLIGQDVTDRDARLCFSCSRMGGRPRIEWGRARRGECPRYARSEGLWRGHWRRMGRGQT